MVRSRKVLVILGLLLSGWCATPTGSADGPAEQPPPIESTNRPTAQPPPHATVPPRADAPPPTGTRDEQFSVIYTRLDGPADRGRSEPTADALREGRLDLRHLGWVSVEDGVPWSGWDESTSSHLRLLHGLVIVNDLLDTRREEDRDLAVAHVAAWAADNLRPSPAHPMAWHDETTARRTLALVRLHDQLTDVAPVRHADTLGWLDALLDEHVAVLLEDEFHATGTNHGMFQDRAILVAVEYLALRGRPLPDEHRARTTASQRLLDYYRGAVNDEGVHLEHAPAYHDLIARNAVKDARFLDAFGRRDQARQLRELHARMVRYATHILQPDGTWPLVSDTFARDQPGDDTGDDTWDDPGYRFAVTAGAQGTAPARTAVVFAEAGEAVLRDRWATDGRATYVHLMAGYHGAYHKHADDLSVWLYHDGPLLTELGPHGYTMDDPLVACGYADRAHNVATVEGVTLPRVDDRVGATRLTGFDLDTLPWRVSAVNERLDEVTFARELTFDPVAGRVEITDTVTSRAPRRVHLRWHLDPQVRAEPDGLRVTLYRPDLPPATLTIRTEATVEAAVLGPDVDRCTGLRLGTNPPEPTTTLVFSTDPRLVTTIHTEVLLTRDPR